MGYDIHIVTSRPETWARQWRLNDNEYILWNNNDLREVAKSLGIKKENIHFMGYDNKYKFFENEDFIFHLDDDYTEVDEINKYTKYKMNKYKDIDPYGEEIWENEILYGFQHLESIRGLYPEVDIITDRLCRERDELQEWFQMPWWKKLFNKPKSWI